MTFGRVVHRLSISAVVVLTGVASAAHANDRGVRGTTIPALACQLFAGGAEVSEANLSWIVTSGQLADISCPVPLNNIDLGGEGGDNDISKFRIHYRDSDGAQSNADVIVNLLKFTRSGGTLVSESVCQSSLSPTIAGFTRTTVPCVHDVAGGGAFYSFLVSLGSSGTAQAEFVGIDFPE